MKAKIILGFIGIFLVIAAIWLGTHSVISVTVPGSGGDNYYTVTLTNQKGERTTINASGDTVRRVVAKGNYSVLVSGQGSYLKAVQTKGFLQTTAVTAELQEEAQRTFVGENPGPCMYYLGGRLISGSCEETAYDVQEHVPATASMPTYIQNVETNSLYGMYKRIVGTRAGENVLLAQDVEGVAAYKLQSINNNLTGGVRHTVPVEDIEAEYTVEQFREGVVVYDTDFDDFLYYRAVSANPEILDLKFSAKDGYKPFYTRVTQEAITVVYNQRDKDAADPDGEVTEAQDDIPEGTEVFIYRDANDKKSYSFKETYLSGQPCGTDKLCLINDSGLSVYDISGNEPRHVYDIPGITDVRLIGGLLLATAFDGVYRLNADQGTGFLDYAAGSYQFCGIEAAANGYLLCVFDQAGNKSALLIDAQLKDTGSIDKKVLSLRNIKDVSSVSAHGRFVYIAPDYGDPIYDASMRINIPDPAKVKIVNNAISAGIAESGIDQSQYTVINTGTQ